MNNQIIGTGEITFIMERIGAGMTRPNCKPFVLEISRSMWIIALKDLKITQIETCC
jgi:hypothetical protein